MEQIWWNSISKAAYLIRSVADTLLSGRNLLLVIPDVLPWRDDMMELISKAISSADNERRLKEMDCPDQPSGKFLLDEFCKPEKRAEYRPRKSIVSFLAASEGIVLNSSYLWLRNISAKQLTDWCSFISEYNKAIPYHAQRGVFILEVHEDIRVPKGISGLHMISFEKIIDPFDVYTFCALSCTDGGFSERERLYLSQTVSSVCGQDVELCKYCIAQGKTFLKDPAECLNQIVENELRSNGLPFTYPQSSDTLNTKIWESQIKTLFPIIEQYRSRFVKKYYQQIKSALPVENAFGESISSPCNVELGTLIQLTAQGIISLSSSEYDLLDCFRNARNTLAHLRVIPYDDAVIILRN